MEQKNVKQYVAMDVHYTEDGELKPTLLYWPDGKVYRIEKILEVKPGASMKVGGAGMRYTIRVSGEDRSYTRDLYLVDNRWFVEVKVPV